MSGNVNIDLSTNNGTTWTSLQGNTANDGTQTVTAPQAESTQCLVRVQGTGGTPSDTSNSNFTVSSIGQAPVIYVTTPSLNFGEMNIGEAPAISFVIANVGGGVLSGTITSDQPWIVSNITDFNSNSFMVSVSVDSGRFAEKDGNFTGNLTVDSNGGTVVVPVTVSATCVLAKPNPVSLHKRGSTLVTFFGSGIVPGDTAIRIYTLSGELVRALHSDASSSEIGWNGLNASGLLVTPGIYIYTHSSSREKGIGKFTVVR